MNNTLTLIPFFVILMSCTYVDSKKAARKISSEEAFVSIEENEESYTFRINGLWVLKASYIPLYDWPSINYESSSYKIKFLDSNIQCKKSKGIKSISQREFEVKKITPKDYLICHHTQHQRFFLSVEYTFPKAKSFSLEEAHWQIESIRKQFSIDQIELAKIYKKIELQKKLFSREKEFLVDHYSGSEKLKFDPRKKSAQLTVHLDRGDYLLLQNFKGGTVHKEFGHIGIAGRKITKKGFLVKEIPGYSFFCKLNDKILRPSFGSLFIEGASVKDKIRCYINSRSMRLFEKKKVSGEVHFDKKIYRRKQNSVQIKQTIAELKIKVKELTRAFNLSSKSKHESLFKDFLKKKSNSIDTSEIDTKEISELAYLEKSSFYFVPIKKSEKAVDKLNYHLFFQTSYKLVSGLEFKSSRKYVGELKTNGTYNKLLKTKTYEFNSDKSVRELFENIEMYLDSDIAFPLKSLSNVSKLSESSKRPLSVIYNPIRLAPSFISECRYKNKKLFVLYYDTVGKIAYSHNLPKTENLLRMKYDQESGKITSLAKEEASAALCSNFQSL